MSKVYVIKTWYFMPHDLQPQHEVHHTCYTNIEDARKELNNQLNADLELDIFKDEDGNDMVVEIQPDSYELLSADEYWSNAEIVELKLK